MAAEKEKDFVDFIKLASPGTPLRTVINDLLRSNLGATIVFSNKELAEQKIVEGGFRINCKFSPQRLFELCKMDGAIVISQDVKKILFANVMLAPDMSIPSIETGTRHKSAERTAKQVQTFVITVSERRRKTTLYYGPYRYNLKTTEELTRNINTTLQILEKQKEVFIENMNTLNILEITGLVTIGDFANVIQRCEIMVRISDSIKRDFTELGHEGNIMYLRFKELVRGIEKAENEILRDYSPSSLKRSKAFLKEITFNELLNLESLAKVVFGKDLDEHAEPKGYRFLNNLQMAPEEVNSIVSYFKNLKEIIDAEAIQIKPLVKSDAEEITKEIKSLREQILSRKVIY